MLKIWGRVNSINVQKVMWTVGELGLAHERVDAGMRFGVVGEPFYGELNPNRLVPTIEDDGVVLWESNAIVRYLATKHASGTLMPADLAGRAMVEQWMDWQQTTAMIGLSPLFLGLIRTPPEQRDAAALARAATSVESAMRVLDRHLTGRSYMMGAAFTAADIPVGAAAYRWTALPIERPDLPALQAWLDRLTTRAAFAAHVMMPLS